MTIPKITAMKHGGIKMKKVGENSFELLCENFNYGEPLVIRPGAYITYINHYTNHQDTGEIEKIEEIPGEEGYELYVYIAGRKVFMHGLATVILYDA